jgi:hypothetical protein
MRPRRRLPYLYPFPWVTRRHHLQILVQNCAWSSEQATDGSGRDYHLSPSFTAAPKRHPEPAGFATSSEEPRSSHKHQVNAAVTRRGGLLLPGRSRSYEMRRLNDDELRQLRSRHRVSVEIGVVCQEVKMEIKMYALRADRHSPNNGNAPMRLRELNHRSPAAWCPSPSS